MLCPLVYKKDLSKECFIQKNFGPKRSRVKKFGSKKFFGFGSTEIFHYIHTRTDVAWKNVDLTNVPKTVDNSCRCPNHPTFKVWPSSDQ